MSVLLLIEYSLEVANGKGFCKDLDKDYYRIGGSWECWEAAVGLGGIPQSCLYSLPCPSKNLGFWVGTESGRSGRNLGSVQGLL